MLDQESNILNVCGLWLNTARSSGQKFFSGNLGNLKILIFKNKEKKTDRHPDYYLCVAPRPRDDDNQETSENEDEIPF